MQPADQLLEAATELHRAGKFSEARPLYQALLSQTPAHRVALYRSGLLELQDGHPAAALDLLKQAGAAGADEPRHRFVLGQALQALGRWDEAIAAHEAALAAQADFAEAWGALGICRQMRRQFAQAAAAYRHALALDPGNAVTLANLGTALREMGELDQAIASLRAAVGIEPETASHAVNLGIALWNRGDFAAAERILDDVLVRHPDDADAAFNLGNALHALGRSHEAIARYAHAVARRPGYADALINLGNVQTEIGDFAAAQASYGAALAAAPDSPAALNNAACLMRTLGRIDEAEELLRRALRIDPGNATLYDTLGNVCKDAGALDAAIDNFARALELDPGALATHSNLAYSLSFQCSQPERILAECLRWNDRFAAPKDAGPTADGAFDGRGMEPDRRLRIGYVSPDFRVHCQSLFTIPLLSHHDHAAYEIFCYSSVKRPDDCTRRLAGYADVWRDVGPLEDAALARLVREDGIDILVDLTMHMAGGRPLLFAQRAAPIQIAWLAYPGTTGMRAMDYRLSDPRLDPPEFDAHYTERTVRLPDSFWCYDPLTAIPAVNALPAALHGYVTFGCLNNPCKLSDLTLRLWGAVMQALPTARLVLMAPPGRHRQLLLQRLAAHGIAAARVDLQSFRPRDDYLCTYHGIDVGLDTLPYNGHTTTLDSLWMGVPVVTRVGETCVGRGGLSQLHQLDLQDLAAASDTEFVSIAVALAGDTARLASLRGGLRERLQKSALMDAARFTDNLQRVYRRLWQDHCRASAAQ
jgi:predicted O-linked N-acetylglucosamine transferase (SPINDLY family)